MRPVEFHFSSLGILRWTARCCGLFIAGGYAFLMIGEMATPHSGSPSTLLEWTGITLLTISATAMLLAWRWEMAGGMLSLAALGVHAAMISGSQTYHKTLLAMAVPGILYCVDWFVRSRIRKTAL